MSDTTWVIKDQVIGPNGNTFGTITASPSLSSGKWTYNGSYAVESDSEWSAWIDNNPQVFDKKSDKEPCLTHDWADTGGVKTWCKKCDLSGRWEMGNVVIVREEK
jgi:hypothetical protein